LAPFCCTAAQREGAIDRVLWFLFHPARCCSRELTGSDDNNGAEQLDQHQQQSKSYYGISRLQPSLGVAECRRRRDYLGKVTSVSCSAVFDEHRHKVRTLRRSMAVKLDDISDSAAFVDLSREIRISSKL